MTKKSKLLIPVIIAGGVGSRLWPLSRKTFPKQLLPLFSDLSCFQETLQRACQISGEHIAPIVICHEEQRFLVAQQLQALNVSNVRIILEPEGRSTAPAVAIAAQQALAEFSQHDPLLLVLPADHVIQEVEKFFSSVELAVAAAQQGYLMTFGIQPTAPVSGYGYIKAGKQLLSNIYQIDQFIEKPAVEKAKQLLAEGNYYWNSGMFLFSARNYLKELAVLAPAIFKSSQASFKAVEPDFNFLRLSKETFLQCPDDSIDCAIMEKTQKGAMVPCAAVWSDVGSWQALWELGSQDEQGNVKQGDVIAKDVVGSYLHATSRLLAVVGVKDHVVIETADAVLVAPKDNSQSIKALIEDMKQVKRSEVDYHRIVYRPWGHYEVIDRGERFQVKRLTLMARAAISLQKHSHRSEHWVVVKGVAEVTCGERVFTLEQNQSTYIPQGETHRLRNLGETPLEIIEVQVGGYLGEDDIVRF